MSNTPDSPLSPERLSDEATKALQSFAQAALDDKDSGFTPRIVTVEAHEVVALTTELLERRASPSPNLKPLSPWRDVLQRLVDLQNGCPLPKYEAEWSKAMEDATTLLSSLGDTEPWKPIEEAPKDGTPIRIRFAPVEVAAKWGPSLWGGDEAWIDPADNLEWGGKPVEWLPNPPKGAPLLSTSDAPTATTEEPNHG